MNEYLYTKKCSMPTKCKHFFVNCNDTKNSKNKKNTKHHLILVLQVYVTLKLIGIKNNKVKKKIIVRSEYT